VEYYEMHFPYQRDGTNGPLVTELYVELATKVIRMTAILYLASLDDSFFILHLCGKIIPIASRSS
jgi:phage-related protein